jgi:hypothetical protein
LTDIEKLYHRVAEHHCEEARFKSEAARQDFLASQARLQHSRNWNRPSIFFQAELRQEGDKWVAAYGGVSAEGNCPEQAYLAFDDLWVGK